MIPTAATIFMYLIQLLLPTYDNAGERFAKAKFDRVQTLLTRTFGGIPMFKRPPAEGPSKEASGALRDDIVIVEIMTPKLARPWWEKYRCRLEHEFKQDRIIVRASSITVL